MKRFHMSIATPVAFFTVLSFFATNSFALINFNPASLAALNSAMTADFIRTIAVGADHRAMTSASSLGSVIGLDIGVDVAIISTPASFKNDINTIGVGPAPDLMPIPRLNVHKGLPWGVDLGFSMIAYGGTNSVFGGDVKWTFVNNIALPAVAFRVGYTKAKLFFMDTSSWKFDVLASKSLGLVDPYVGIGLQALSGDLTGSAVATIPGGVATSYSQAPMHVFAGLPIKLLLLKITAEYDYSFTGITTYGAKVSFAL